MILDGYRCHFGDLLHYIHVARGEEMCLRIIDKLINTLPNYWIMRTLTKNEQEEQRCAPARGTPVRSQKNKYFENSMYNN